MAEEQYVRGAWLMGSPDTFGWVVTIKSGEQVASLGDSAHPHTLHYGGWLI